MGSSQPKWGSCLEVKGSSNHSPLDIGKSWILKQEEQPYKLVNLLYKLILSISLPLSLCCLTHGFLWITWRCFKIFFGFYFESPTHHTCSSLASLRKSIVRTSVGFPLRFLERKSKRCNMELQMMYVHSYIYTWAAAFIYDVAAVKKIDGVPPPRFNLVFQVSALFHHEWPRFHHEWPRFNLVSKCFKPTSFLESPHVLILFCRRNQHFHKPCWTPHLVFIIVNKCSCSHMRYMLKHQTPHWRATTSGQSMWKKNVFFEDQAEVKWIFPPFRGCIPATAIQQVRTAVWVVRTGKFVVSLALEVQVPSRKRYG